MKTKYNRKIPVRSESTSLQSQYTQDGQGVESRG